MEDKSLETSNIPMAPVDVAPTETVQPLTDDEKDGAEAKALGVTLEEYRAAKAIEANTSIIQAELPVEQPAAKPVLESLLIAHEGGAPLEIGRWPINRLRENVIAQRLGPAGWINCIVTLEKQEDGSSREISPEQIIAEFGEIQ